MPKVLRIINRFNLGGPIYNVSYLSAYLAPEYETLLIGGKEEPGETSALFIPESMGLKPLLIKSMRRSINPLSDYKAYKEIKKIIKTFKPDIVHTHASKAGTLGRLAAFSCKVPVVVHTFHGHVFHNYFSGISTGFFKRVERFLAKKSSAVITISNLQKKELVEIHKVCSDKNTFVIPLGFDLKRFQDGYDEKRNFFREKHNIPNDVIVLGIIGRLTAIKNHFLFIDSVIETVLKSEKNIRAFIIGDGELRKELESYSENLLQKNSVQKQVFTFYGWEKQVENVLPGLDIVCLTSLNEGTPVSLIEAQAAGKFIVTTNAGGIKDILHPACGIIAETKQEFISALIHTVSNYENATRRSKEGIDFVMTKFSYIRMVNETKMLYEKLLAKQ